MTRLTLAALLLLAGCGTVQQKLTAPLTRTTASGAHPTVAPSLPAAGSGRGGYYLDDGPEEHPPAGLLEVPDAVVRAEPRSKYANRPYVVFGKTYTPLVDDAPFSQRGMASWYGKKFHGQRTSSGELYDMYKMSAAHPTLPIPSYARITSLSTGKQVIVRINDRGPFHSNRIVDVSYTAALKLGLLGKGSHEVELERILPGEPLRVAAVPPPVAVTTQPVVAPMIEDATSAAVDAPTLVTPAAKATDGFYLQLGAYSRPDKAAEVRDKLLATGVLEMVEVVPAGVVNRIYGGPFASREAALKVARALPAALAIKPIVVRRSD
ncbi:MAG TPA: septal ring lytic transglycosylase RlpA family protein [Telluria sp.]|nr:septal ring lytic transglycosylase RlpA family protein [Telluria sp.]